MSEARRAIETLGEGGEDAPSQVQEGGETSAPTPTPTPGASSAHAPNPVLHVEAGERVEGGGATGSATHSAPVSQPSSPKMEGAGSSSNSVNMAPMTLGHGTSSLALKFLGGKPRVRSNSSQQTLSASLPFFNGNEA
jgi:hypothetical protein